MTGLWIVYDSGCAFCRRCRLWLERQDHHLPVRFLPASGAAAREAVGHLLAPASELAVIADDGRVWIGAPAFVVALWATRRFRPLASRLHGAAGAQAARAVFGSASASRHALGAMLGAPTEDVDDRCRACR